MGRNIEEDTSVINVETRHRRSSHLNRSEHTLKITSPSKRACRYVLTAGPRKGKECGLVITNDLDVHAYCVMHRSELFVK